MALPGVREVDLDGTARSSGAERAGRLVLLSRDEMKSRQEKQVVLKVASASAARGGNHQGWRRLDFHYSGSADKMFLRNGLPDWPRMPGDPVVTMPGPR